MIWSQSVVDKICHKHGVTPEEVEEAIFDDAAVAITGRSGTYWIYGRALSGRLLFVVVRKNGRLLAYKVITAREMDYNERKYYAQHRR